MPSDDQLVVVHIDLDGGALLDRTREQRPPDSRLQLVRDEALQRARAVHRVVALGCDEHARGLRQLERHPPACQPPPQILDLKVDDLLDLLERERLEEHDVVHTVQELGPEVAAQVSHHAVARVLCDLARRGESVE